MRELLQLAGERPTQYWSVIIFLPMFWCELETHTAAQCLQTLTSQQSGLVLIVASQHHLFKRIRRIVKIHNRKVDQKLYRRLVFNARTPLTTTRSHITHCPQFCEPQSGSPPGPTRLSPLVKVLILTYYIIDLPLVSPRQPLTTPSSKQYRTSLSLWRHTQKHVPTNLTYSDLVVVLQTDDMDSVPYALLPSYSQIIPIIWRYCEENCSNSEGLRRSFALSDQVFWTIE